LSARGVQILSAVLLVVLCGPAVAAAPDLEVSFPQRAGTVGDRFPISLHASGQGSGDWEPLEIPDRIGPFHVLDGSWRQEPTEDGDVVWVWSGGLAAYEPGELELPAISVRFRSAGEVLESSTEPIAVTIESVLGAGDDDGELSDLKDPAAVEPDYTALMLALSILAVLLLAAAVVWWVQRRYAGRLAAVPQPADPFKRMTPHEWAYQALQELLRDSLADPEHAGPFFEEIARILKLYLGGRFRIDLMESTTSEIGPLLSQAGAAADPITRSGKIFGICDMVKFAGHLPRPADFRSTVEEAYALVDATRPLEPSVENPA
jgi:hypothetical protein